METLFIDGPAGKLEVALHLNGQADDFLIICHPHPLFDGTMNNKVVTTVAKTYLDSGINVVRFNFRGVGKSEGEYGEIKGEVDDCLAILKWLKQEHAVKRLFLAGFSFGAYVAAKVAHTMNTQSEALQREALELAHLLLVAPSVLNSPFDQALPLSCPTSVIMGRQDEVVAFDDVSNWADGLYPPVEFVELPDATHFFHGQLVILKKELKQILQPYLNTTH